MQSLPQAPYSRDAWRGLLGSLFASAANLNISPAPITDGAFGGAFTQVVQLGDLATSDGKTAALLEIQVAPGVNLARNRAGVRHLAARLLDGVTRQANLAADIAALECELDRLVTGLYGLSAPESAIAEGKP